MNRCINLDWLEVYALEDSIGFPHNAEFFRRQGFYVDEREYGTPVYHEMFYVYGRDDQPMLEVRRSPKSAIGRQVNGVLDPMACHIRLCNRTCYFDHPAQLMQQFLETYGLHYQRISRIDIALDFELFDYGDRPSDFVERYMRGRYAKINQSNIRAHGKDMWDGRTWNSIAWGNLKSMVGTKLYNKTMELREAHDKPYIRHAWKMYGLVDDDLHLTKHRPDGTVYEPDIWRVEFSIKSGTRNWFVIEDNNGLKKKIRSMRNDLSVYSSRQQLLDVFFSLTQHYFHFKKYKAGVRKDRCEDKLLFRTTDAAQFVKIENVPTNAKPDAQLHRILSVIQSYRDNSYKPEIYNACNILVRDIEMKLRTATLTHPWPADELTAIRLLISQRIKSATLTSSLTEVRDLLALNNDIFGEHDQKQ